MLKRRKILLFFVLLITLFLAQQHFSFLNNQALASSDLGVGELDQGLVLKSTDPRTIAVKIINIFLGLLATIALVLVLYGGFTWMTSGGNEEKISRAKQILKNAAIGLIIILASWGIVTFVLRSLFPPKDSGFNYEEYKDNYFQSGLGALGNCAVESVYPSPGQKEVPRNTNIMVTFKEAINLNSISNNSVIICEEKNFNFSNNTCSENVAFNSTTTPDNKIIVLSPEKLLGYEDGYSEYLVLLNSDILKKNVNQSIFSNCSYSYLVWNFEVSNLLDLTPPKVKSFFPFPDNGPDQFSTTSLTYAQAQITIQGGKSPNAFSSAKIDKIEEKGNTQANSIDVIINPNFNKGYQRINLVKINSNYAYLILFRSKDNDYVDFGKGYPIDEDTNKAIVLDGDLIITFNSNALAGDAWDIFIDNAVAADYLQIANEKYYFVDDIPSGGYNINIHNKTGSTLVGEINSVISNNLSVNSSHSGGMGISLTSKIGGSSGNNLQLFSSSNAIGVTGFTGGIDYEENSIVVDKPDQPRNAVIQITFDKAINPITVVGDSSFSQIKIFANEENSSLSGNFSISSDYKTVEFKSNQECGVNSCGEKIYCLPAFSKIRVDLKASDLFVCANDNDCSNKAPFSNCSGNNICINSQNKRYPLAVIPPNGIVDTSNNSFDGNSDGYSYGPVDFYHANLSKESNSDRGDNFRWFFFTNNVIETNPPKIEEIYPDINATSVDLFSPIKIKFNKLMMHSSLRTGTTFIGSERPVEHSLINIISTVPVGYWLRSENLDEDPLDNLVDRTRVYIDHGKFYELMSQRIQVGSGVKDVYQNCYKPSAGLNCSASDTNPYCCDGVPSSSDCSDQ